MQSQFLCKQIFQLSKHQNIMGSCISNDSPQNLQPREYQIVSIEQPGIQPPLAQLKPQEIAAHIQPKLTRQNKSIQNKSYQINELKQKLMSIGTDKHILNKSILQLIFNEIEHHYLTQTENYWFLKFLNKYLQFFDKFQKSTHNESTLASITNQFQNLGQEYYRNVNQIHFNHHEAVKILERLFAENQTESNINLNMLKYDLRDKQEVKLVAKIVKMCCQEDLNSFFFLSTYMVECCQKISQSKSQPITQIQKRLQQTLNFLRKQHPPNDKKPAGDTTIQYKQVKKLQHTLSINLNIVQPQNRNKKLQEFIVEVAQNAKEQYENLVALTKPLCYKNNGIGYKSGLKVKDSKSKSSIDRVKEKLLSKNFQKYNIPNEQKNLQEFLKNQQDQYHKTMNKIFSSTSEKIPFTVGDMLRGKCMFQEISQIKKATQSILQNTIKYGYAFEIDNRLGEKTTDLVFKIKIQKIVAQFQLAYKFNVVKNEFNHKIYQLARSKFFSCLNTLFIFNNRSVQFFNELLLRVKKLEKNNKEIRIKMNQKQQLQPIGKLVRKFQTFLQSKKYDLQNREDQTIDVHKVASQMEKKIESINMNNSLQIDLYDHYKMYWSGLFSKSYHRFKESIQYFQKAKECLTKLNQTEKQNFKNMVNKQLAHSLQKIGKNAEALKIYQELFQFNQTSEIINRMGKIYFQLGNYEKALQCYQKCVQIQEKNNGKDNIDIATLYNNIGLTYFDLGNYPKAKIYYQNGLKIYQNHSWTQTDNYSNLLINTGSLYYNQGNFADALKYYQKCLKIQSLIHGEDSFQISHTYNHIGLVYSDMGNYPLALKCYQKCYKIQHSTVGQDNVITANTLNNIGIVYLNLGNYTEALRFIEKALKIQQQSQGQQNISCVVSLNNIGRIYINTGKYDEALKFYNKALNIQTKTKGQNTIDNALTLTQIGNVYFLQGYHDKAMKQFEKSLKIASQVKGDTSIDCVNYLNNIGRVHAQMGNYDQSLKYYQKAICIITRIKGQDSISLAGLQNSVGLTYFKCQKYEKALESYQKALHLYETVKGSDNIDCATPLNNIGLVYYNLGNNQQSLNYLQKALAIQQNKVGKDSINCSVYLNNIGKSYYSLGNYKQALKYFHQSLKIYQNILGENAIDSSITMINIAKANDDLGNHNQAIKFYQKSIDILKKIKGEDSFDLAVPYNSIGMVYYHSGVYDKALEFYKNSLHLYQKFKGEESIECATPLSNIGTVYADQGNQRQAIKCFEKSIQIQQRVLGKDHISTSNIYNNIGLLYYKQQNYTQALKFFERSVNIKRSALATENLDCANALCNLGFAHFKLGNYQEALKYCTDCLKIRQKIFDADHPQIKTVQEAIGIINAQLQN